MSTEPPALALRALPEIARTGSVSAAARALGVSQPAVSRALGLLEDHLGLPVLRRGRLPVALTEEGAILARYAERDALLRAQAFADVGAARRHRSGTVRIGSFGASASTHLLPDLFARLRRRHPGIAVEVREVPDMDVLAALRDGTADLGVVVDVPADLDAVELGTDRLVALLPEGHTLAARESVTATDLTSEPFVMTKGGSEPLVRAWFTRGDAVPDTRHTIQQVTSILTFVRLGLGVSIIAERALPSHRDGVALRRLDPDAPRTVHLARMRGTARSWAVESAWIVAQAGSVQ